MSASNWLPSNRHLTYGLFSMDNHRRQRRPFLVGLILALLASSCSFNKPDGPTFAGTKSAPDGKAIIYFYRPADESFGSDRAYDLSVNGAKTVQLLYGGYFPLVTNPGKIAVSVDTHFSVRQVAPLVGAAVEAANRYSAASLDLKAVSGGVLYVRFHPVTHAASFEPTLAVVPEDVALREMNGAKLLSQTSND